MSTTTVDAKPSFDSLPKTRNLTSNLKPSTVTPKWYLIDANGLVLGRLSSHVAKLIYGKTEPNYTPNVDSSTNVVIINAEKIAVTGKKMKDKIYYRHTGYAGGIKQTQLKDMMAKKPEEVIKKALKGMLGSGPLANKRRTRLYVYSGESHPHAGQSPVLIDFKSYSTKNSKTSLKK